MSSPIIHIKPEEINTAEKRGKCNATIIGCGPMGILHAILFADAGFKVTCTDMDQNMVNNVAKGKTSVLKGEIENKLKSHIKAGRLRSTNDMDKAVSESNIIALAVPVKIDSKKKADYSNIKNTCKLVGLNLRYGSLVIVTSLTGIGITESLIKETLENTSGLKVGTDFALAYSPSPSVYSQKLENVKNHQRILAATDKNSLKAASMVLELIEKHGVFKTEDIKTAETAALFDVLQEDVNIAVANELASFCEKLGVDYLEASKLADAAADNRLSTPRFAKGNIQEEPYLLLEDAENLNVRLRISAAAREINKEMAKHVVNLAKDALRICEKTLRRARISIFGISQTPNAKSTPKKLAKEITDILEARGAKVNLYDPYYSENELSDFQRRPKKTLKENAEGADCIIILTGHDQFKRLNLGKLKLVMRMPAAIVDLEGIVEPGKVEKEGFIYRGLGRGVWTK